MEPDRIKVGNYKSNNAGRSFHDPHLLSRHPGDPPPATLPTGVELI